MFVRNMNLRRFRLFQLAALVAFLCGCIGDNVSTPLPPYTYEVPPQLEDGLPTNSLEEVGLDVERIVQATDAIGSGQFTRIDSMVIVKNGYLVYENYFNGFTRDTPHDLRSATKSITSALVGIAIDQEHIERLETPILDVLSEYAFYAEDEPLKGDIQIQHLLTMTPGLACDDWDPKSPGNEGLMYLTSDWVQFIMDLPMIHEPGERYGYCTGGVVVLGEVIRKATGQPADEYAEENLFGPLQITNYRWEYTPAGQVDTGGHLWMVPRDMAKIGQLFVQKGEWNDERLVSEAWVDESTTFKLNNSAGYPVGYLWRLMTSEVNEEEVPSYFAEGNGGQYIFAFPKLEMVVAFTGSNYNSRLQDQPFQLLGEYILPAVLDQP